jgi:hypothetical protein
MQRRDHWIVAAQAAAWLALGAGFALCRALSIPWLEANVPDLCLFKRFWGVRCPGCGMTHAFVSLAHGQLQAAWAYNPLGPPLFAALALAWLGLAVALLRALARTRPS